MAVNREQCTEDASAALARTFSTSVGGEPGVDIGTSGDLAAFFAAVAATQVDGVHLAGAIWAPGVDTPAVELALFYDCAFLRRGTDTATEPGFFHSSGLDPAEFPRSGSRRIRNRTGEVEELRPEVLLCTPGWVREQVQAFAMTGDFPRGIGWRQHLAAGASTRKAVWRWHGGWRAS